MLLSLNWLREYVDIDMNVDDLCEKLTMLGLEIESVERQGDAIKDLYVGEILTMEPHPNADKLLVLTVDIGGGDSRRVVAGIKAFYQPAELVGKQVAVVANLKPATLRGVESQGMVLASTSEDAIILLCPEKPARPGSPVK